MQAADCSVRPLTNQTLLSVTILRRLTKPRAGYPGDVTLFTSASDGARARNTSSRQPGSKNEQWMQLTTLLTATRIRCNVPDVNCVHAELAYFIQRANMN